MQLGTSIGRQALSPGMLLGVLLLTLTSQALAEASAALHVSLLPSVQPALSLVESSERASSLALLERVYAIRQGEPIWHHGDRLNSRAVRLIEMIARAMREGLSPRVYVLPELGTQQVSQPQDSWHTEYQLTAVYLALAQDLHSGLFQPRELDPYWYLPVEPFDPLEALQYLLQQTNPSDLIKALSPQSSAYQRLREALQKYRQLAYQGGWPELPVLPTLRPGERHPAVLLLRRRLQREGDHPDTQPLEAVYFDDLLQSAVERFQARNGLVVDGIVGPNTQAALNIPVEERIDQIRANMERWRWLPRDLGSQYLLVNTAGFELSLVIDGEPVLHQRTINGTRQRQTPSIASRITHLVVNPKWTVPRLIAVEDLLPKQQRDAEYLTRMEFQVFKLVKGQWSKQDPQEIDWQAYHKNNFPFKLQQAPGDKNSLGRIKLQMPNQYAIFLHDTPAQGLFTKPIRAFSSGCVRVQGVKQLARRLLINGGQSPEELLDQPLQGRQTKIQRLARPMPVYLAYFTSWVDDKGVVHFRPDTYQRNRELLRALSPEAGEITAANDRNGLKPL
jgi:murein L,D-transpeptidase YcbB/YkuD